MRRILILALLALLLTGCWFDAFAHFDDYTPERGATSVDVTRDYETAADVTLLLLVLVPAALGGLAMLAFGGRR